MAFKEYAHSYMCKRFYFPMVTVTFTGRINFNKVSSDKYFLRQFRYVSLFFDPTTQDVGLKITKDYKGNQIELQTNDKNTQVNCSIKSFFTSFNIKHPETRYYHLKYNFKEKMFTFNLNEPIKGDNTDGSIT